MKIRSALLAALFVVSSAFPSAAQFKKDPYADLTDSETVTAMKNHVATISSAMMEGRLAGSEGEKMTAEYITAKLKEYGVDIISGASGDLFGIRMEGGDTLTSRNVVGFIQGTDKTLWDRYIVIGARMDNLGTGTVTVDGEPVTKIYYGANGNASGLAVLLELARMLQTNRLMLRRSVLIVGFGASRQAFAGSWYFLNRSFSDVSNIDAMIDLDMLGTGTGGFFAYTASNADMNAFTERLAADLQPIKPETVTKEPYPSDYIAFYDKKIPSVFFSTGQYPEHDTERDTQSILDFDTMEKELEYIYNYSVVLAGGEKPVFDPSDLSSLTRGGKGAVPYYDCEVKPSFYGSSDPRYFLQKWVYTYMKYPREAVDNGIQGRVQVEFIIDENGKVGDIKVVRGADPLLDAEAVRVVSASPKWKPGKVGGRPVKAEMSLYIEFKLQKGRTFGIKK